jgi:O-antigen ligase
MRPLAAVGALPRVERGKEATASSAWRVRLIWLLAALGSIVFIEPAPYDMLAIGALTALFLAGMRAPKALALPLLLVALFVVGNWLAAAASPDPVGTLRSLGIRTYLCGTFVLFACAIASAPDRMLRALWAGYAVAAVIAVVWGALQYFGDLPHASGGYRAQGAFKDPNVFGPFLVPSALWFMALTWQRRGWPRLLALALFAAAVFGVLISFSRGAWLNLLVAVTAYFALRVLSARSARASLELIVAGFVLFAVAAGIVSTAANSPEFASHFAERARIFQEYDVASGGRFASQARALRSVTTNPIGIGPGRTATEFGLEPHNLYLHVFAEGGWLAGLAFASLLAVTLVKSVPLVRKAWAFQPDAQLALASLAGLLLQSFFIDSTHWRHLYLLLGVLWALIVVRSCVIARGAP